MVPECVKDFLRKCKERQDDILFFLLLVKGVIVVIFFWFLSNELIIIWHRLAIICLKLEALERIQDQKCHHLISMSQNVTNESFIGIEHF